MTKKISIYDSVKAVDSIINFYLDNSVYIIIKNIRLVIFGTVKFAFKRKCKISEDSEENLLIIYIKIYHS